MQPCTTGEQPIPQYYSQQHRIYDFPLASANSMDSGYAGEDADPFEKSSRSQETRMMNFPSTSMAQDRHIPMGFNPNFSFMGPVPNSGSASYAPYQPLGYTGNFQPTFNMMEQEQPPLMEPSVPCPPTEDSISVKSEEMDSKRSDSPQESDTHVDSRQQHHEEQLGWGEQQADTKTWAARGSSVELPRTNESSSTKQGSRARTRKRIPHTAVERRYRENLNAHLEKLRTAVPNLQAAQRRRSSDHADPLKASKCEVLMGAVVYIKNLEDENERLKKTIRQRNFDR